MKSGSKTEESLQYCTITGHPHQKNPAKEDLPRKALTNLLLTQNILIPKFIIIQSERAHPENFPVHLDYCSNTLLNQFFGGTELESGFEKSKHFTTYWLKAFSSFTPQSIKRQN